jgi:hypothetical protein
MAFPPPPRIIPRHASPSILRAKFNTFGWILPHPPFSTVSYSYPPQIAVHRCYCCCNCGPRAIVVVPMLFSSCASARRSRFCRHIYILPVHASAFYFILSAHLLSASLSLPVSVHIVKRIVSVSSSVAKYTCIMLDTL